MNILKKITFTYLLFFCINLFSQNSPIEIEKLNKKELRVYIENINSRNDSIIKINKHLNDNLYGLNTERNILLNEIKDLKNEINLFNDSIKKQKITTTKNNKIIDSLSNLVSKNIKESLTPCTDITFTDELALNPKKEYTTSIKLIIDKIVLRDNFDIGNHSEYYENENGESPFTTDNSKSELGITKIIDAKNYYYCHPKSSNYNEFVKYKSEYDFLNFKTLNQLSEELPLFTIYKSKFLNLKYKNTSEDLQINISEIKANNKDRKYVEIKIQNKNNEDEKITINVHKINNENYLIMSYEQLLFLGVEFRNHNKGYLVNSTMHKQGFSFHSIMTDSTFNLLESSNYFLLVQPKNDINGIDWLNPKDLFFLIKMIEVK